MITRSYVAGINVIAEAAKAHDLSQSGGETLEGRARRLEGIIDSVEDLADQSIAATEQVRQVLGDLNDGVREAVKASREGVRDIKKGLERVQSSAETLTDI